MSKITTAEAEKAADRYLAAQMELKKQKEEEKSALSILRAFCKENTDVTTIGPLLAYSKSFAPKLKGAKAAVEAVIKKLRKLYVNIVPNIAEIQANDELMAIISKHKCISKVPDIELIEESLTKDNRLVDLLESNDVSIDRKLEVYFKHI